ncbi:MAG: DUF4332 domain-containing protein [Desulfobulbaceae bacterium]|nr:MAG: DUF4332 domain-containing protein [Desulfobulbaceae bacterium]
MADFHINKRTYSTKTLLTSLKERQLIPSRIALKNNIDHIFQTLERVGLTNLETLTRALNNAGKREALSLETGIEENYLNLLRREVNSYFPTPVPLSNFSDTLPEIVATLETLGIKNTKQLFEQKEPDLEKHQFDTLEQEQLNTLRSCADLSRLYGVGPMFARILISAGITSVESFVKNEPEEIVALYERATDKKADFSAADIAFSRGIAVYLNVV